MFIETPLEVGVYAKSRQGMFLRQKWRIENLKTDEITYEWRKIPDVTNTENKTQ